MTQSNDYSMLDMKCAYIAGFLDGDGCIGVYMDNRMYKSIYLRVQMYNTDPAPLEFVVDMFGGHIRDRGNPKKGYKQGYVWSLGGVPAACMLQNILPYLIVKKENAKLGIEAVYALKKRQLEIVTELKNLNKMGVDV